MQPRKHFTELLVATHHVNCELCRGGFLTKWMVSKHTKDNHMEQKFNNLSNIQYRTTNDVQKLVTESPHMKGNMSSSYDNNSQKGVFILNERLMIKDFI